MPRRWIRWPGLARPAGGVYISPSSASFRAESPPEYDSDAVPSPEPVRPAIAGRLSDPFETESVRLQAGSSGPASGSRIAIASAGLVVIALAWLATTRTDEDGDCKLVCRRR